MKQVYRSDIVRGERVLSEVQRARDAGADIIHVYPTRGREHDTDGKGADCWCRPDCTEAGRVVIHHEVN